MKLLDRMKKLAPLDFMMSETGGNVGDITICPNEFSEATLSDYGPYQLLRKLGSGAGGELFEAFDTRLQRSVAI
ncbi:MAG: hypothetical protein KDA65_18060, partial [Planctomycetaceae bacterium]|nr:hypothetical protein [Planctomycetaceae bacterium]